MSEFQELHKKLSESLEDPLQINEVNLPVRLAVDDLLSSFGEAYQDWETRYEKQFHGFGSKEFRLAKKMIMGAFRQGFHAVIGKGK